MIASLYVALVLTAALALALGRWIGRREAQSVTPTQMTPTQAERHLHGPEVRGRVIDLAERRRSAPQFRSTRRQQH